MNYRVATPTDVPLLARMNRQLIIEERHRNNMTIPELEERMRNWIIANEYTAILFEPGTPGTAAVGHSVFRHTYDHTYIRQFFITPDSRRQGHGRAAIAWLRENLWQNSPRIRADVLVHNEAGLAFWKGIGFMDYCISMEIDQLSKA